MKDGEWRKDIGEQRMEDRERKMEDRERSIERVIQISEDRRWRTENRG